MAGWISSKLKVAEDFLHQIDQQAAESLKKNEKQRIDEELGLKNSKKVRETKPLLKDQLRKKSVDDFESIEKFKSDFHNLNLIKQNSSVNNANSNGREKEVVVGGSLGKLNPNSGSPQRNNLTDNDWTELLSVPSKGGGDPVGNKGSNGVLGPRRERRDGRKQGSVGMVQKVVALDGKRGGQNGKGSFSRSVKKSDVELGNTVNGGSAESLDVRSSDVGDGSRTSSPSGGSRNDKGSGETGLLDREHLNENLVGESKIEGVKPLNDASACSANHVQLQSQDNSVTIDGKIEPKQGVSDEMAISATRSVDGPRVSSRVCGPTKRSPVSPSNEKSDSETESGSSSGSESEQEREQRRKIRQQILAEKAAAKAVDAIKERENKVARLEGEKQSLEKILGEQAKKEVIEASQLQTTMMQTMEAVELEKQKHNNTRMEALARLAKLEATNADLARSLAFVQKTLENENNRVTDLRQRIELKEDAHEEYSRKISSTQQNSNNLPASKGVEFEREMLEAEYSFLTDKVGRLQEKANTLETSIYSMKRELENPTEVEVELKRRLGQLTDHLIQKQAQVEALSSEKAFLLFKIEAASRSLDEKKSIFESTDSLSISLGDDLESGQWEMPNSKLRPLLEERLRLGKRHLGSLVQQLDSIFCSGAVFLRRNSTARIWSLAYLLCLHIWVIYIFMSHSPASNEGISGAVVSLESINKTGGA